MLPTPWTRLWAAWVSLQFFLAFASNLTHRNWRVREGLLRSAAKWVADGHLQGHPIAWPAVEYPDKGALSMRSPWLAPMTKMLYMQACDALGDAQPDLRGAGVEAPCQPWPASSDCRSRLRFRKA